MSGSVCSCPSRKCHLSFPKMWAHCNNLKAFSSVVRSPKRSDCQELCRPVMTVGAGSTLPVADESSPHSSITHSELRRGAAAAYRPSSCLVNEILTKTDSRIRINLLTVYPAFATSFIRDFSIYQNSTRLNYQKTAWKDISIRISSWAS